MSAEITRSVAATAVSFFGMVSITIWSAARVYLRRLEILHAAAPSPLPAHVERRLERIEQAIDAVAVEMERVSEGQRFAARLLADRRPPALPDAPPRVNTPH